MRTGLSSAAITVVIETVFFGMALLVFGLPLFLGVRVMQRAGATISIGWIAAAASCVVALLAAWDALPFMLEAEEMAAVVLTAAIPGLAMAACALAAQMRPPSPRAAEPPGASITETAG
jgi:hypothetical protein